MLKFINLIITLIVFLVSCSTSMQYGSFANIATAVPIKSADKNNRDFVSSTKLFIARNFNSAKNVIEYESEERGIIIIRFIKPYPGFGGIGSPCSVNVSAEFKNLGEGKVQVDFNNISPSSSGCSISIDAEKSTKNDLINLAKLLEQDLENQ